MTVDEVDRALARLGAVCDTVAARLVALDGHQGARLLDAATLGEQSRRRWADAQARLADLWAGFEAYRSALASARELRGRRQRPSADDLVRLSHLLCGPSIELPADHDRAAAPYGDDVTFPQLDGDDATSSRNGRRLGFDELARRMEDDYGAVLAVVTAALDGWSALAQRLDPLTARLASARSLAAELGLADDPELAAADAELAALRSSDPLAVPLADPLALRAESLATAAGVRLDRAVERLATVRRLRDGYAELRAGLAARIARLGDAYAEAARLHETVRAKIATVDAVPPDGAAVPRLLGYLDELDGLHGARAWDRLAQRYAEVAAKIARETAAAQAAAENLRQLLDRRAELRGRLEAYRAKAGRLGHGEDVTLAELHRTAHELLWAAPCDLAAATRAVANYQRAVLAATARRGEVPS
jgi:hypothetical protein